MVARQPGAEPPPAVQELEAVQGDDPERLLRQWEGQVAFRHEPEAVTDRVRAVGTVWLGQTIGCAQCHDHKFDPITSRDFYSLGAFFADIKEASIGRREDGMVVPDAPQAAELAKLEDEVTRCQKTYELRDQSLPQSGNKACAKPSPPRPTGLR